MSGGAAGAAGAPDIPDTDPFAGPPEEYWREIERLRRDRFEECLGMRADYDITGYQVLPVDYFIERFAESNQRTFRRGLESGRLRFDADAAGACLAKVSSESCEELRRDNALLSECYWESNIVGTVETGGFCERWEECESPDDVCYVTDSFCSSGKCTPRSRPGESCDFIGCIDGARCSEIQPYVCEASARAKEGESCASSECEAGLFCSGRRLCHEYSEPLGCTAKADCPHLQACLIEPGEGEGICGPGRAVGAACGMGASGEDDCTWAAACRDSVCTDVWVPEGATCRNTGSRGGLTCIESRCQILDAMTQEGVCGPFPGEGEVCTVGGCAPGFDCTVDGCTPLSFCERESCGAGTYCSSSGCLPEKAAGEMCSAADECGFAMACVGGICGACE
jgi:hypothetical protein